MFSKKWQLFTESCLYTFFDIFWANERTALVGPPLRYLLLRQTHRFTASKRSSAGSFTHALNRSVQRLWHCWVSLGVLPGQLKLKHSPLVRPGNTLLSGNNPLLPYSWGREIAKLRQKENCPNMENIHKIDKKNFLFADRSCRFVLSDII